MPGFLRNGVEIHYELDGAGEPAVYIPGLGAHSNDVLALALRPVLSERYRLLTVDNRGAGQSCVPAGTVATIDDMADDVAAILDYHGMTPAHVLGISMGGCIAKTLALRHPDKVRSLVSAVSLAHAEYPGRAGFMLETSRMMRNRGVPRDILNRYNAILLLSEAVFRYEAFLDVWVNAPPDPLEMNQAGYDLQKYALERYDIRARLPQISVPTLVMSSPDDLLVPPHFQDEIATLIPGAQIKRYSGGHVFMMLPTQSAQFVQDVLAFWRDH
ncbi:MAG: alpha/beta fold hydrolase [Chloroflexi bacterium]|nr:alpha/beta fold hydrolase [Chloroflexota bacterium]